MGTTLCSRCRNTAVYKAGDVCSTCRYQLRHPETIPKTEAPPVPQDLDAAELLRRTKSMAADQIQRLESALAGDGVFQGDTLNEMTKLTRVLEITVELELKLRKAAKTKIQTNDERVDAVVVWFREQLPKAKQDRMLTLLQEGR